MESLPSRGARVATAILKLHPLSILPWVDSPYTIERPTPVWSLPNFLIRAPAFLGDTFPWNFSRRRLTLFSNWDGWG